MATSFLQDPTIEVCASTEIRGKQPQSRDDSFGVAPQAYADELDRREIVGIVHVMSSEDASELPDPIEKALDQFALAVEPGREAEALLATGAIGNVGPDVAGCCSPRIAVLSQPWWPSRVSPSEQL